VDFAISFLRRRATGWLGEQEQRPLEVCPGCDSCLVQPVGWKELASGHLFLRLRCPECAMVMVGTFGQDRVADYDDALVKGRDSLRADYEALVRHNMEELAEHFKRALELDLIGAEDFEGGRRTTAQGARLSRTARFAG
jgi:hypothetical protein